MKTIAIIFLNLIVNALTGFYIFARSFNDKNFGYEDVVVAILCIGIILGIISGFVLKTARFIQIIISILPLLGFLGLMVLGSIEKGSAKEIILVILIFIMPLVLEGVSWFLSASISKRFPK